MTETADETLAPIEPIEVKNLVRDTRGRVGRMTMIPVTDLRIDMAYQRKMSPGSVRVVRRICHDFDWAKFLPVIVVERDGVFAVVDGQHRTTAALTLGIEEVPCYILECSHEEAASAFAAINGNVTPVSPQDVWFAQVAAGDPEALELKRVLDAADVRVVRKKEGARAGDTRSVAVLRRARETYGDAVLTTILQCIVQTGNGNPGMITGAVVNGIGKAIITKTDLLNEPSRLFDVFDKIDLADMLDEAKIEVARTGNAVQFIMTREINAVLRVERVAA